LGTIPYIERRRRGLYLRVRVPADLRSLVGKDFFTKSLKTSDPRHARAEAARLLARLHHGWNEARRQVVEIAGKRLDELAWDDVPTLRPSDLDGLTAEEQDAVLKRLDDLADREEFTVERLGLDAEKLKLQIDQLNAITSALGCEQARAEHIQMTRGLLRATQAGAVAPPPASQALPHAEEHEYARIPWNAEVLLAQFYKDRPSIGASSKVSNEQAFAEFEELVGAKRLGEIRKSDVVKFADHLRDQPINRGGRTARSHGTIVKLLGHLKSYLTWAKAKDYLATNPGEGVQARAKTHEEKDPTKQRRAFKPEELTKLFDSPLFTGCKAPSRRSTPGKEVYRDERYWYFLIALLTGARENEVAGLPSALVDVGGVQCLDFRHATKSWAGPRLIPILPELRRLGIVEWAAEQARRGRGMVTGPNASEDWSKWCNRYLRDIGLTDPHTVLYSLRHNFRQQLRATSLNPEIVNKVFGHEDGSVGEGYGRDLAPDEAKLVVEQVRSPVPLEHLMVFSAKAGRSR
jgi:integrase